MARFLAWLSFAFLLAGPQGFAGWKHFSLHESCRPTAADLSCSDPCESDGEIAPPGCWICTSIVLGAAVHCDHVQEISFAPPALAPIVPSFEPTTADFAHGFSARAPPLS